MKSTYKFFLFVFYCVPYFLSAQQVNPNPATQQMLNKSSHNFFIENKGQWPKEVRYLAKIGGMDAWITQTGVVYDYYQITRNFKPEQTLNLPLNEKEEFERKHTGMKGHVVNMMLEGANKDAESIPEGMQQGYYNYFIDNDSTKWASFVRMYDEVLMKEVYPGIDIRYYFDNGLIRYDYIAKPGADLAQINIKIKGSDGYRINEKGELTLKTSLGKITHGRLYAYQNIGNRKSKITCSFIKNRNGQIGVSAENYNTAFALVIDPLVYSTYIGGGADDLGRSIAIDGNGNAFVTGNSTGSNYPTTTGAYDVSFNGGSSVYGDVIVTKLNASGSAIIYSTYIGGSSYEYGSSIAIDGSGNAYVTGFTQSTNYPTTTGAFDVSNNGLNEAFVTKLNTSGSALVYSTYLGGSDQDYGYSIAIDGSGNAFIAGGSYSTNFPTTTGVFDVSQNGSSDVFVTKLNASGTALAFSTFIGGSNTETVSSITVDGSGIPYITGTTQSTNYPTTAGAYKKTGGGIFVTKITANGSALYCSTFIGDGTVNSIKVDGSGNAYITGAGGTSFPTTSGAYDINYNGGTNDAFVTKLNASGSSLVYSTFIGGSAEDVGYSIAIDGNGNAYITGETQSTNYPTTPGAYDLSRNGIYDVFVTKLNSSGSALDYSTYIGGNDENKIRSIAIDGTDNVLITGYTFSSNYPTTTGAYDVSYNGGQYYGDLVVTKILTLNQAVNIYFTNLTSSNATFNWTKGGGTKRAVFVKQTNTGIALPINNNSYTANSTFSLGSQIGTTGWYCVYNDTGTSLILNGLSQNTSYKAMVCEYIGSAGTEYYITDSAINNPGNFITLYATPSTQAHDISFSNKLANSFTASWSNGNGSKRVVLIKATTSGIALPSNNITYIADTSFKSGTQIGTTGWYCVYNGTGNSVSISGLSSNTKYRVMVCEYNGTPGREQYNTDSVTGNPNNQKTDYEVPAIQANGIIFTDVKTTSFIASWTKGNGTSRAVFIKTTNSGSATPANNITYTADTIYGTGSQINTTGWYCVYNDTGSTVRISNLSPIITYRLMVCEYNGTPGYEKYNSNSATNNPNNQTTDIIVPLTQAYGISFSNVTDSSFKASWTKGTGISRLVFIKADTTGTAEPVNKNTYTADTVYSSGSQIGTTGWYCIYNNNGSSVNISKLQPRTNYRVMVCEYNGISGKELYNTSTSTNNPANQKTDFAKPSLQASNIIFSNITFSTADYTFTRGNGSACLVLLNEGITAYPPLTDNTTYAVSSQVGTSGWFCKYNGTLNTHSLSGLHAASYKLMVCEYNGTPGKEKYNKDPATKNPKLLTIVGINEPGKSNIKIYPNPTTGQLVIENAKGFSLNLFNAMGESMINSKVADDAYTIDLYNFADGIYFLKMENKGILLNQKLILKH